MRTSSRRAVVSLSIVSAGTGLGTALSAAAAAGPFAGLHPHPTVARTPRLTPVSAAVLFPAPQPGPPVVKTVDVFDPPPAPPVRPPQPMGARAYGAAPMTTSSPSACEEECSGSRGGEDSGGGDD